MAQVLRDKMRTKPKETKIMHQEWRDLLFLSWKYKKEAIQETLPPGLFVDTFKGDAYVTLAPFMIQKLSIANSFSLPFFSEFIEVNVRTYVYDKNGIPGVWFYSLDINSMVAAAAARQVFSLPYYFADLKNSYTEGGIKIKGKRGEGKNIKMQFSYKPKEELYEAEADTLDFFLIERHTLYAFCLNRLYSQRIYHLPYALSSCSLIQYENDLFEINSLESPSTAPNHACYSPGLSVDFFPLKKDYTG